jgi:hypothetical protein
MPSNKWIGSFSTKTLLKTRKDIRIVTQDPVNHPYPDMRILFECTAAHVGAVTWQVRGPNGQWTSQNRQPPYQADDLGTLLVPTPPTPLLLQATPVGQAYYAANWQHRVHLRISAHHPWLRFRYQRSPTAGHPAPQAMYFTSLQMIQQIQTAGLAVGVE